MEGLGFLTSPNIQKNKHSVEKSSYVSEGGPCPGSEFFCERKHLWLILSSWCYHNDGGIFEAQWEISLGQLRGYAQLGPVPHLKSHLWGLKRGRLYLWEVLKLPRDLGKSRSKGIEVRELGGWGLFCPAFMSRGRGICMAVWGKIGCGWRDITVGKVRALKLVNSG